MVIVIARTISTSSSTIICLTSHFLWAVSFFIAILHDDGLGNSYGSTGAVGSSDSDAVEVHSQRGRRVERVEICVELIGCGLGHIWGITH